MKYRKDDLIGIRKARFASFVLLLVCFAAMLVVLVLSGVGAQAYIAAAVIIAALVFLWWIVYRNILYGEAVFFEALATDMRAVHRRLRILESAVQHIGDGVVIVASDGELILVNETVTNLLAAFDDDLDGVGYDEHAADFSEKLLRSAILESAREGRLPETIGVDGQFYKIGYVGLTTEKGGMRGAVAVISDVTDSTKAERMQADFVANVTHELKTPLASVKSYAETILAGAADNEETKRDFLETIVSEADHMDRLIKNLKNLDNINNDETKMIISESDLPSLVKTAMKKLAISAAEKSLSVNQMFIDDLHVNVEMNREYLEQVIINILNNAIKYTEEKGRIDVDVIPGQGSVQIVISDNGIGIPEESIPRVFERFYRVDPARSGKMGGSGLGLAISKQIIDMHGGTISIESKYGRGATVTISLPARRPRGIPGIE